MDEFLDPSLIEDVEDADPYYHADALATRQQRPVISFDCGVDDDLIEHNRQFHAHLDKLDIEHRYAEFEGGHEWDYWDLHVREALVQHAQVLGVAPVTGARSGRAPGFARGTTGAALTTSPM